MLDYSNPFLQSLGNVRAQPQQNQFMQPQNQYDFSGWGDRLGKIEQGIAGLTDQFNNFQKPGDVAPEYQGNTAPEPLGQTANAPEPLGGIESLVAEPWQQGNMTSMGHTQPSPPGAASFTLKDPRDAYMESMGIQGTPTNVLESMGIHPRMAAINEANALGIPFATDPAPPGTVQLGAPQQTSIGDIYNAGLTPGESNWEQLQLGLPRQGENWAAPWLQGGGPSSPHGGSSWEPRGAGGEPLSSYHMFQGPEGEERLAGLSGNLISYPPNMPQSTNPMAYATINPAFAEQFQYQGRPNDMQQPMQQGVGLTGLVDYRQNKGVV